ncbi:Voltage-dependent R-type calcium channel subunit alpha-1E [Tetrabaena socialis]|nr:Voltage-dependent R-type calcium channel subunit alpha-1E [Tetrabaena socialis]|eukprot:PNH00530.1 Voltage-dependent R-type calcium channel subunit alpha-1E [Tetrabaena socialis]
MGRVVPRKERDGDGPPLELSAFRRAAWRVAVSKGLEYTTATLIVLNTIVMCVNWHLMPTRVEAVTNYINVALTIYFLVELLVKLTAFGFKRYFDDGMNIFDALVVAVSVTELVLAAIPSVSGVGPLSVLRAFRLLRVFRLARHWRELDVIIRGMLKSVTASIMLVLLMLLFLLIASLVGMQLFGYQ